MNRSNYASWPEMLICWEIWWKEEKIITHLLCFKWPYLFQNWKFFKTYSIVDFNSFPKWSLNNSTNYTVHAVAVGSQKFKGDGKTNCSAWSLKATTFYLLKISSYILDTFTNYICIWNLLRFLIFLFFNDTCLEDVFGLFSLKLKLIKLSTYD